MKGLNTLQLNQATMVEAVQVWLDRTLRENQSVTVKKVIRASSLSGVDEFAVIVEAEEKTA